MKAGEDRSENKEKATDNAPPEPLSLLVLIFSGLGSAAGTEGGSRAGGIGGREGGRNNGVSGRDGDVNSALLSPVIDPSNQWSQVGVLHVGGEVEFDNRARSRTREALRRGEVVALSIDDDGVPAGASDGGQKRQTTPTH